jgi:hypothetical protein
MNAAKLFTLIVVSASLCACAAGPTQQPVKTARVSSSCGQLVQVINSPAAYVVEGFDGPGDSQLFVTKQRPVTRCSPGLPAPSTAARIGQR